MIIFIFYSDLQFHLSWQTNSDKGSWKLVTIWYNFPNQCFSNRKTFELKYETFLFIEAILGPLFYTEGLNPITYFCDAVKWREHFLEIIRWYLFNLSSNNCVVVTAALKRVLISRWSFSALPKGTKASSPDGIIIFTSVILQLIWNWVIRERRGSILKWTEETDWSNSEPEKKLMQWWPYSSDCDLKSLLWSVFARANKW